jgi:hypothetical protein
VLLIAKEYEMIAQLNELTDYCSQICGGGECGNKSICSLGIDSATRMPAVLIKMDAHVVQYYEWLEAIEEAAISEQMRQAEGRWEDNGCQPY